MPLKHNLFVWIGNCEVLSVVESLRKYYQLERPSKIKHLLSIKFQELSVIININKVPMYLSNKQIFVNLDTCMQFMFTTTWSIL